MDTVERFFTSATPERIWAILADVERWREWTPTVLSIEPLTAGGLRMGAKYRVTPAEAAADGVRGHGLCAE